MSILKTMLNGQPLDHHGEFWKLKLDPPRVGTVSGKAPLLYFGGISDPARQLCAEHCDVFLMWPETEPQLAETMQDMSRRAAAFGRTIDFGLRIHVIVRETRRQ